MPATHPAPILFTGTPALYAALPPKQRQRRTATNIMAGCFDPLPALVSDSGHEDDEDDDEESSSAGSVHALLGATRPAPPAPAPARSPKDAALQRAVESLFGRGKAPRRVPPAEKENAVSDSSDTSTSLSPAPPAVSKPKASGFWRARSSNTPDGAAAPQKRKHASLFDDDSPSPSPPAKKARVSRSPSVMEVVEVPPEPPGSRPKSSDDSSSDEQLLTIPTYPQPPAGLTTKAYKKKITEAVRPHTRVYSTKTSSGVRCELCMRGFKSRAAADRHFTLKHTQIVAHLLPLKPAKPPARPASQSAPAPAVHPPAVPAKPAKERRVSGGVERTYIERQSPAWSPYRTITRGPRKNVAIKKGWKGWVEEDLEPQKLILLDKPEVLPERTTRSGRKID